MNAANQNYKIEIYSGSNNQEQTIFRQLPKVWDALLRIFSAIEFRFNKLTFGLFELFPTNVNRALKMACLAGLLYFSLPFLYKTFFKPDSIFEDTSMLGFSLAPANPRSLRDVAVRDYVMKYKDIAIEEMHKYKIPASISMAQAIIESRCGESRLAEKNNNHFGIKCFRNSCKKGHCSNFTDDSHKDFFRKYEDPIQSWREHSILLSSPRFKDLKKSGNDYENWAQGLEKFGYATNKDYAEMLIETIELYGLDELDDE